MQSFGDDDVDHDDLAADPAPMYLELGSTSLDMMQIPMPLDIPFPGSTAGGTASTPAPTELELAHVMYTDDLIDYSSSGHIRQRGANRRDIKIAPVARYFPLVPPSSYTCPGNNIKSIQQQFALRLAFLRDPHPTREMLIEMSVRFGLPSQEITTWFKTERHRFKKQGGIVLAGNASSNAWHMAMQGLPISSAYPVAAAAKSAASEVEKRAARAADTRRMLSPYQLKRSRAWAEEYALLADANERAFRVRQLVDRQDARLKKEFRAAVVDEPSLGLRTDQEFKARKSCADPSCSREVVAERADSCWEFMRARFGSNLHTSAEKYVDNDGNILLDAALLTGLEVMFLRHRDYFMALAHRFRVQDTFAEVSHKRQRTATNDVARAPAPPQDTQV